MAAELVVTVLQGPRSTRGFVASFAVTDERIVALGGTSRAPLVLASSDGQRFAARSLPRGQGLRDILAAGDALWACGEYGQLAVSRDHGGRWQLLDTGTDGCLFGLALASDGAVWVVGDDGYAARVLGERARRVDLATRARLVSVHAVRDEIVALGADGQVVRWRDGELRAIASGAPRGLTGLAVTGRGTWVLVGDGGFVARSPDGVWYSRVDVGLDLDLEAIVALADGSLVIVGDRGQVLRSTDDARTWRGVAHGLGLVHLWAAERFGRGALIGGDEGMILKLAPEGDATWHDRADVVSGARSLDAAFADGPDGFLANGLAAFLAATSGGAEEPDAGDGDAGAGDDDDGDDDDDDDGGGDDDGDGDGDDDGDDEAFAQLGRAGGAEEFRAIHGVDLPAEARQFFALTRGCDRWSSFCELRLDQDLLPDVGDHNLFELLVRRNQRAYLGTDLVEAFCGVFGIGSQGNGDTYHLEVYAWDGPRQVLHFDHETAAFSGVLADSLESLVYLAALVKAGDAEAISREAYADGLRRLSGRVAPSWHFAIDDKLVAAGVAAPDGEGARFSALDSDRRDSEFFYFRSRWICALLKNDGVTELDDVAELLDPDLNQVVAADQLAARLEACEAYVPTALYAMWRAYLFDEPELARYLELGRAHAARLVRDAARLIDELRAGRNTLGTIEDVRGWLARFRALDLDPRRAAERAAEAAQRAQAEAARRVVLDAALDAEPRERWADLAWQWLDDGLAHRALLTRLEHTQGEQIAAIDELRDASDVERAVAVERLARALTPELEAVLVGSLVRDDRLTGVLARPAPRAADAAQDDAPARAEPGDEEHPPGWRAIERALEALYPGIEPLHYAATVPYALGGSDPLLGISVYARTAPAPHWHFITFGFTDLFGDRPGDQTESGFGFELTLRLARPADETRPPAWALNLLQNLARYVFGTGNAFAAGHKMGLNGPIALDSPTQITAVCFVDDPELGELRSPFGSARFVQAVGITDDEYRLVQEWSTTGLIETLTPRLPLLWTDLARASVLADPRTAAEVRARVDAEGSSEDLTFVGELEFSTEAGEVRVELASLYAVTLPRAMRGRILHGRGYQVRGQHAVLALEPASAPGYRVEGDTLVLEVSERLARELEQALEAGDAGTYRFAAWPPLTIEVAPSIIRAQDGRGSEVRGVRDPDAAARILAEDEARRVAARAPDDPAGGDGSAGAGGDGSAGHDRAGGAQGDDVVPPPARVAAALAMTERALRLAPDDDDLQYTHAMLLLDAERGGAPGAADALLAALARFVPSVRASFAVRLASLRHPRLDEAIELALGEPLPAKLFGEELHEVGRASVASFGNVAHQQLSELGDAIFALAPRHVPRFVAALPPDAELLTAIAERAIAAAQPDGAAALYARLVALAPPVDPDARASYLRALGNACIHAHAAKLLGAAVEIADRAQPHAGENPYIFHAAACAYVAVGDLPRALEQVRLAIEHDYDHIAKLEVDADLGPLLTSPDFHALFRDWHARREGN